MIQLNNMSRRIKQMREHTELLTLRMQLFCIDPKWQNFLEICDHKKLISEKSDVIKFWKNACISKYGTCWAVNYEHPMLTDDAIFEATQNIKDMGSRLQTRLKVRPRAVSLDSMWYMFFATGDLSCLREAYSVGGSQSPVAVNAVEMYQKFRNVFETKLKDALESDSDYFNNHEVAQAAKQNGQKNPMMSSDIFDQFDNEIKTAMSSLRTARELGDEISPEMHSVLDQDDETDHDQLEMLKKFMTPENANDLDSTLKKLAHEQKKLDNLDSQGKLLPKGYVEYTKQREKKEMKRVGDLFDKMASTII